MLHAAKFKNYSTKSKCRLALRLDKCGTFTYIARWEFIDHHYCLILEKLNLDDRRAVWSWNSPGASTCILALEETPLLGKFPIYIKFCHASTS